MAQSEKRSKLLLVAAVLGTIYGCAMLSYLLNNTGTAFFEPFIAFCVPLVVLLFIGVVFNLIGFITRKSILVLFAIAFYALSALCVAQFLPLFTMVGMWRQTFTFFAKYSLPVFPSIILCIAGFVRRKKDITNEPRSIV